MNTYLLIFILIFLPKPALSNDQTRSVGYCQIKPGDTLGSILLKHNIVPLWGKNGSVQKTIKLNPGVINQNGDFLSPHSVIRIPMSHQRDIASIDTGPLNEENSSDLVSELFSHLKLVTGLDYSELKSIEKVDRSNARLETKLNPSFSLIWDVHWSTATQTTFEASLKELNFNGVLEKEIRNLSAHYGQFSLSQKFNFRNGWQLAGTFDQKQYPYLRAITSEQLKIESPWMQSFHFTIKKSLIIKGNGEMSLGLTPYYILGKKQQDYTIEDGHGASVSLNVNQKFKKFHLEASVFGEYGKQDSSITEQSWRSNGIKFGLVIPFGKTP